MSLYRENKPRSGLVSKTMLVVFLWVVSLSLWAENAVTTADPTISTDYLALQLLPMTKDELAIEAEGWRDLLRSKVLAITSAEIAARKSSETITEKKTAEEKKAQVSGDSAAEITESEELEKEKARQKRQKILEGMNALREEKAIVYDRFITVLDAYGLKGGDTDEYRKYAEAVSGITVEMSDSDATWGAIKGWVNSTEGGLKWALRALQFVGIMLAFWMLARFCGALAERATKRSTTMSGLLKTFLDKFVRRGVIFVGLLVALSTLGFNVSALVALVGGGAFIIGLALQDTLGNFAAGMMLLFYRPFDVGDIVEVGGISGQVDNVSLVSTTIRSFDNKVILVPNKQVWGQVITNSTASHQRRVDLIFGIGYDDDIDKAKSILEDIVAAHDLVLDTPEPVIELHTLGESSVDFVCRPWSKTEDYWRVYWDITKRVKEAFSAADINIPYPQRDVHIYPVAEAKTSSSNAESPSSHQSHNTGISPLDGVEDDSAAIEDSTDKSV